MIKYIAFILVLFVFSCGTPKEEIEFNKLIEKNLKSDKDVDRVFMDLKFGMSITEFNEELENQYKNGKLKRRSNRSSSYAYEFEDNKELLGVNFLISPGLHNDSIVEIRLHSFKKNWVRNYNSLNFAYKELIEEYVRVYGQPTYKKNSAESYWLKDNLIISVTKKDSDLGGVLNVYYENKRKLNSIDLFKCHFDEFGNSMDLWYYKLKEIEKSKNTDI